MVEVKAPSSAAHAKRGAKQQDVSGAARVAKQLSFPLVAPAKLAGLPNAVTERAKVILAELEAEDRTSHTRKLIDDLPLFAAARPLTPMGMDEAGDLLAAALAALNPDEMSPRDAMDALYALKAKASRK